MDACERFPSRAENSSLAEPPVWTPRIHSLKLSVVGLSRITRPPQKWIKQLSTWVIIVDSSRRTGGPNDDIHPHLPADSGPV